MSDTREVILPMPESLGIVDQEIFDGLVHTAPVPLIAGLFFSREGSHLSTTSCGEEASPDFGAVSELIAPLVLRIVAYDERKNETLGPANRVFVQLYHTLVPPGDRQLNNARHWHADNSYVAGTPPVTECLTGVAEVPSEPLLPAQSIYHQVLDYLYNQNPLPDTLTIDRPDPRTLLSFRGEEPGNAGTLHRAGINTGLQPLLRTVLVTSVLYPQAGGDGFRY